MIEFSASRVRVIPRTERLVESASYTAEAIICAVARARASDDPLPDYVIAAHDRYIAAMQEYTDAVRADRAARNESDSDDEQERTPDCDPR